GHADFRSGGSTCCPDCPTFGVPAVGFSWVLKYLGPDAHPDDANVAHNGCTGDSSANFCPPWAGQYEIEFTGSTAVDCDCGDPPASCCQAALKPKTFTANTPEATFWPDSNESSGCGSDGTIQL